MTQDASAEGASEIFLTRIEESIKKILTLVQKIS